MDRDVARLVGLAGARPPLPAERAFRIRTAVAPAWLNAVRARRRRRITLAAALLAAGVAIAIGLAIKTSAVPSPAAVVAQAERITGAPPTVVSADGSTSELAAGLALRTGQRVAAGPGRAALRLSNGASLRIDAHSEVVFVDRELLALNRGAVYVDSEQTGENGISIRTPLGTAREIGTRFEVRMTTDRLRVRVRDGRVALSGSASSAEGGPREEMTLHGDGRIDRDTVPAYGPEWSWVVDIAPPFALENRKLGEFLAWLQRETGWSVRYQDSAIAARAPHIAIHGPAGAIAPADALPLVMAACELSYRLHDGILTIGPQGASQ